MAHKTRTFIGVALSDSARKRIGKMLEQLAPKMPGVRWVDPAGLHLTLAFLGEVEDPDLAGLCRDVEKAVAGLRALKLDIRGFGSFPPGGKAKVVWVGLEGDIEGLMGLQKAVAEAVSRAGYPPTDSRFHPHITLGKVKGDAPDVGAITKPIALWSPGVLEIKQVTTYASLLRQEGPEYRVMAKATLGRGG
jgi:2'-5' RNA ligase